MITLYNSIQLEAEAIYRCNIEVTTEYTYASGWKLYIRVMSNMIRDLRETHGTIQGRQSMS